MAAKSITNKRGEEDQQINKDDHFKKVGEGRRGEIRGGGRYRGRGQYISQEHQGGRGRIIAKKLIVTKETDPKRTHQH